MTKLEQVIAKVSTLPPEEQEYYAAIFLDQLKNTQKCDKTFAASQVQLTKLDDEVLQEFEESETTPWISHAGGNGIPYQPF
jgi:hypothetical protein